MKNFKMILLVILVSVFIGCQTENFETNQPVQKTQATPTPEVVQGNTPPTPRTDIRNFNGKGVVTKINLELVSVELNHEEIKGLMPAMIMEFYVKEKSELEKLKVGDKVEFVLEDRGGAEKIISIKKAQ